VSIIYFYLLHSQIGRLYNDNTTGQVLCVELWLPNGFTPSMLIKTVCSLRRQTIGSGY
jgi:hypothetical protein